jgi:hypothetical protein
MPELFSVDTDRYLGYAIDAWDVVFSPRRFLRKVSSEELTETIRRILAFALALALFELLLFRLALSTGTGLSYVDVFSFALLEIILSLILVPALYAVAVFAGAERPAREAIAFALSYRMVVVTIPLALFVLFLVTEDYSFALLKGVAVWLMSLAYVTTLPLSIARTRSRRAAALALSLFLFFVTVILISTLASWSHRSGGGLSSFSLLADPIGAEVNGARNTVRIERPVMLSVARDAMLGPSRPRGQPLDSLADRGALASAFSRWRTERASTQQRLEAQRRATVDLRSKVHFETTQKLLDLSVKQIEADEAVVGAIDEYLAHPSTASLLAYYKADIEASKAGSRVATQLIEHLTLRNQLISLSLLDCSCDDDDVVEVP